MLNISIIDINKMNDHRSSQTTEHKKTYGVGNAAPALGHAQRCGGVKHVNGIPNLPTLDNWISNDNTDINKQKNLYVNIFTIVTCNLCKKNV